MHGTGAPMNDHVHLLAADTDMNVPEPFDGAGQVGPEYAKAVATSLKFSTVGIEHPEFHRYLGTPRLPQISQHNDPVRSDSREAVAHRTHILGRSVPVITLLEDQVVVPEAMCLVKGAIETRARKPTNHELDRKKRREPVETGQRPGT